MIYRIRRNSITEDVYLGRNGAWTTWAKAAVFTSVDALERFAAKWGIEVYKIF